MCRWVEFLLSLQQRRAMVREMLPREQFGPDQLLLWLEDAATQRTGSPFPRETPLTRRESRMETLNPSLYTHLSLATAHKYYVETPAISSIIDVMKTTTWGESGFPSEFLARRRRWKLRRRDSP